MNENVNTMENPESSENNQVNKNTTESTNNSGQNTTENVQENGENSNTEQPTYEELINLVKAQSDEIKEMKIILNENFKNGGNPSQPIDDVESYLSNENSMTSRILRAYQKENR